MTNASTETSTERVPGRAWTIRLTGNSDRTATLTCSTAGCRMPARSKDLAALRQFAARHAAAHAKAATVRPNAWCHCGSQRCAGHPDARTHCAGAVLLIRRHDPTVGRVWSVEEVCETCAPLLPNATVVARAARAARPQQRPAAPPRAPLPGVASGFSSPAAPAEDRPAPVRRSRRTPRQQPGRRRSGQGR